MTLPRPARGLAIPLVVLALWWSAFALGLADTRILASPGDVFRYLVQSVASGDLWIDLGSSLARNFLGFALGALAGIAGGIFFSLSPLSRDLLLPSVNTIKHVSIFAWIPFVSIWFGLGEGARVFIIAFAVWFPVFFNTLQGVAGIPRELLDLPRVYKFSRLRTVWHVILPAALPSIFTGLYVGLVISWMVTLGAEYMLTSTRGIGHLLLDGRDNFRMDQLLVGVLVIGLVGYLIHVSADALEHRLLRWRGPSPARRI
jgi:sulfonate transport system permease protein